MKNQLEKSLRNAVDSMPHPSFEKIAAVQVKKMEQMDFITRQETEKPVWERARRIARLSAACLAFCFCLILGGRWYTQNLLVYNIIDLDVNPSFEMKTNKKEQVLSLRGCNEEAAALLSGTSYKNMAVDDAVESLIVLLQEKKYISENQKTVLLTVGSRNDAGGAELKIRLSGKIKDTLKTSGVNPVIIRQTMNQDKGSDGKETKKEAKEWSVSKGKLQLIRQVMQNDPEQSMEKLASMPVEQILDILNSQEESLPKEIEVDIDEEEFDEDDQDDDSEDDDMEDVQDDDSEDDDRDDDQENESSEIDDFDEEDVDKAEDDDASDDKYDDDTDDKADDKDDDDADDEDHGDDHDSDSGDEEDIEEDDGDDEDNGDDDDSEDDDD